MMKQHKIHQTFEVDKYLLKEYEHWTLSVRYDFVTIGGCVAITKKDYKHLRELSKVEWDEFGQICKDFERVTGNAFGAEKWNYLCLMMVDEHTHFHLVPRYSNTLEFAGHTWEDHWWPKPTAGNKGVNVPDTVILAIRDEMKKFL